MRIAAAEGLQEAAAQSPPAITSDSTDALLRTLSGTFSPPLDRGALDVALAGGRLDLIADERLRLRVAAWERRLRVADLQAANDVRVDQEMWMPFLRIRASVPQIMAAAISAPEAKVYESLGMSDVLGAYKPGPVVEQTDHRALLKEREFVNLLQEKKWAGADALLNYSTFVEPELDSLVQALKARVGSD